MNRIVVKSKVSSDGILHLSLPLGIAEANTEVNVIVEPVAAKYALTQVAWQSWVDSMAGTWQGDFEREPQGELEERELLS